MTHPWSDKPSPDQARQDWHRAAAERDNARLAEGPDDDTERYDSPWRRFGEGGESR